METKEAFFNKIIESGSCWIFKGYKNKAGYGIMQVNNRRVYAHRYAFHLYKGLIPDGMMVLHSCDNPPCVNPNHLSIGTQSDNMRQASERGRLANINGENNPNSKLSMYDVCKIRTFLGPKPTTKEIKLMSEQAGVSPSCIRSIIKQRTWRQNKSK